MLLENHKTLGHYVVGDKKFTYKNAASYESIKSNQPITWNFFNDVWEDFSKNKLHTLGKESLKSVYKRRAQQLRDEYDYLILHYSGGSDSHEILMTFLENGIKLDEVFVQMAVSAKEKIHTPNTTDSSASNILSEYDYVIKPMLAWLHQYHPDIKITVNDYLENYETKFNLLLNEDHYLNNYHITTTMELMRAYYSVSDSVAGLISKERKVAEIIGVDKPLVVLMKDNKFSLFFHDVTVASIHPVRSERYNVNLEPFYWTPKMPEICFEQAYVLMKFFKTRPDLRNLIDLNLFTPGDSNYRYRLSSFRQIYYGTIYHHFDPNTFQVDKPNNYSNHGRSREKYFVDIPEFKPFFNKIDFYIKSFLGEFNATSWLDDSLLKKHYLSPAYTVGDFTNI